VRVPVVQVRVVRMTMAQRLVPVPGPVPVPVHPVHPSPGRRPGRGVSVVLLVAVRVLVLEPAMLVPGVVALGEVEPQARAHQHPATTTCTVTGSRRTVTARIAPMNGASER
jgi:hypothetical protein